MFACDGVGWFRSNSLFPQREQGCAKVSVEVSPASTSLYNYNKGQLPHVHSCLFKSGSLYLSLMSMMLLACGIWVIAADNASAAKLVQFPKDKSATTLSGSIKCHNFIDY